MLRDIIKVYKHYGGLDSVLSSKYFWTSVLIATICYRAVLTHEWSNVAISVIPSLTGFTIASYALIFATLRPDQLRVLLMRGEGGKVPLLQVSSSITHAVIVQVLSLIVALISKLTDAWSLILIVDWLSELIGYPIDLRFPVLMIAGVFSLVGLVLTAYGLVLVVSSALSIFGMHSAISNSLHPKS